MIASLTLNPALDVATSTAKVVPTSKLRCGPPKYDPGGGGINVARVILTLGGEAVAVFPAGGATGQRLVELVDAAGLPRRVVPTAGPTRMSFTVDEAASGQQYRFVMPGPELAPEEQECCLRTLGDLAPAPRFLVASGSLPPGVDQGFYGRICELAQAIGAKMILDTSGPALRASCRGVFLLKPNLRELEDMAGTALPGVEEQLAAARQLVADGKAQAVVISLGAEGALWANADEWERLPGIPVEARSAIGAGDSMVGAMALALARGWPMREAVRYGMAAGAAALLTPGTELCRREDVERLFASYAAASSRA